MSDFETAYTATRHIAQAKLWPANLRLLDPEEAEMLQDMLVAGINSAIEQSQAMSAERMEGITGGLGGGLDGLLGGLPGF